MQVAGNFMLVGLGMIVLGAIICMGAFAEFKDSLMARIYPNGKQKLATECYVEERVPQNKYDGYFYRGKDRKSCKIVERRKDEVKITWEEYEPIGETATALQFVTISHYDWIPKKDFHAYHNLSQVSKEELKKILK